MTNRYLFIALFFFPFIFAASGQGNGELTINADLSSLAKIDPDIEVSVINLATNKVMKRKNVEDNFEYTFPLNARFMLYFKKPGTASTRLLLDTRTFMSGYYELSFDLVVGNSSDDQGSSSTPIGTIKFDLTSTSFGYKASKLLANQTLTVSSSVRKSKADLISF